VLGQVCAGVNLSLTMLGQTRHGGGGVLLQSRRPYWTVSRSSKKVPEQPRCLGFLTLIDFYLVGRTIAQIERELILQTLRHNCGNRTHSADLLGISVRTPRNKLRYYKDQGEVVAVPGQQPVAAAVA
jgi:hypothetical protein